MKNTYVDELVLLCNYVCNKTSCCPDIEIEQLNAYCKFAKSSNKLKEFVKSLYSDSSGCPDIEISHVQFCAEQEITKEIFTDETLLIEEKLLLAYVYTRHIAQYRMMMWRFYDIFELNDVYDRAVSAIEIKHRKSMLQLSDSGIIDILEQYFDIVLNNLVSSGLLVEINGCYKLKD